MLKNIKIKTKLIFVLLFLSVELIFGAAVGLGGLYRTNKVIETIYEDRVVALVQLSEMEKLITLNQALLSKAVTDTSKDEALGVVKTVEENAKRVAKLWDEYRNTYLTDEEKKLVADFEVKRKEFLEKGLEPTIIAIKESKNEKAIEVIHGAMEKTYEPMDATMKSLVKLQADVSKAEYEEARSEYKAIIILVVFGISFGLLMALFIGIWLIKSIMGPLNIAVDVSQHIAKGDLTKEIKVETNDEAGHLLQALKDMSQNLITIVNSVRNGTDTIATAANQIAAGNLDLSSRTEEQAGSLEETASAMEELTSTVKQNAENAQQANQLAKTATEVAVKGGEVISQVVNTMEEINDSSKKVSDIISVIDGIAFQTNILALNAAVEAARAGEQGRGFAVVAAEVRSLAQRSAQAAKEIKSLIENSVNKVETGSQLVNKAGNTMQDIIQSITRVTDIVNEISSASHEQSSGIEQVNQAIVQMDQATQQNAALVEEAAAAADSMREQAESLTNAVHVFKT